MIMGFFDKIKGAMNAVTGGGARVTIEYNPPVAFPGEPLYVRITAQSTGGEVKSGGIFVDVWGSEDVHLHKGAAPNVQEPIHVTHTTFNQAYPIAPGFVLAPNETKVFDGTITFPHGMPSYEGHHVKHVWTVRGRVEAFGNDPDSGYVPIRVGLKG
jgi:hypothetical protein